MNVRTQALRSTLFASVGIHTEYLLGVLVSILIARKLEPAGFGAYSLVVWLTAIGVTTTNSGTTTAVIKFVAELRGAGRDDQVAALVAYLRRAEHMFLLVVLAVGGVVLWGFRNHLATGLSPLALSVLLVLTIGLRAPYMFNIAIAKGFERFDVTAVIAMVATPLNLLMVLVAWAMDADVAGFLVVFAISSVVFHVLSRYQVAKLVPRRSSGTKLPPELIQRMRRHMLLVAATVSLSFFATSETEVLFLSLFGQSASAGHFKVAYQLATGAALLVPGVFGAVLLPLMSRAHSEGRQIAARRFVASTSYLALLAMPLIVFGFVFSGLFVRILYGEAYAAAGPVLAGCLFAASIMTVSQAASSLLLSADQQQAILVRTIVCGVLKILLDIVLIRQFGLHGALFAYVAVSLVSAVVTTALAIRVSGQTLDWPRLGRLVLVAVLSAAVSFPSALTLPPIAAVLVGGTVLVLSYAVLTLVFGCWSSRDIDYLKTMHGRLVSGRPRVLGLLLDWAGKRAVKDPT